MSDYDKKLAEWQAKRAPDTNRTAPVVEIVATPIHSVIRQGNVTTIWKHNPVTLDLDEPDLF